MGWAIGLCGVGPCLNTLAYYQSIVPYSKMVKIQQHPMFIPQGWLKMSPSDKKRCLGLTSNCFRYAQLLLWFCLIVGLLANQFEGFFLLKYNLLKLSSMRLNACQIVIFLTYLNFTQLRKQGLTLFLLYIYIFFFFILSNLLYFIQENKIQLYEQITSWGHFLN